MIQYIHLRYHEEIRRVVLKQGIPDQLVFTLSENGAFSSKLYTEAIIPKGIKRAWSRRVWHNLLPSKIFTFLWKLMCYVIHVDNCVQKGFKWYPGADAAISILLKLSLISSFTQKLRLRYQFISIYVELARQRLSFGRSG